MSKLCCGRGHEDQRTLYPVGTRVKLITEITGAPNGATGRVTDHCDDGRAWVIFDDTDVRSHTFHKPEDFLTVIFRPVTIVKCGCHPECNFYYVSDGTQHGWPQERAQEYADAVNFYDERKRRENSNERS